MTSRFFVLEKTDGQPEGERYMFIRDGWSLWAFAFPLFWLVYYRQWFAAALVFLATVGLIMLASQLNWLAVSYVALLAMGALVGFEGGYWRAAQAAQSGYREIDRFEARDCQEAQLRFALDRRTPVSPPPLPSSMLNNPKPQTGGDMIFADIAGRS